MDNQANKSAAQDTAGMDPKGKECNGGPVQAMSDGLLPTKTPLLYSIAHLRTRLDNLNGNHDDAVGRGDYEVAQHLNTMRKDVAKGLELLTLADRFMR